MENCLLGCFCGSLPDEGELIAPYLSGKGIAGKARSNETLL
jgi:hypothetical protein